MHYRLTLRCVSSVSRGFHDIVQWQEEGKELVCSYVTCKLGDMHERMLMWDDVDMRWCWCETWDVVLTWEGVDMRYYLDMRCNVDVRCNVDIRWCWHEMLRWHEIWCWWEGDDADMRWCWCEMLCGMRCDADIRWCWHEIMWDVMLTWDDADMRWEMLCWCEIDIWDLNF